MPDCFGYIPHLSFFNNQRIFYLVVQDEAGTFHNQSKAYLRLSNTSARIWRLTDVGSSNGVSAKPLSLF